MSRVSIAAAIFAIASCSSAETPAGTVVATHTFDEASAAANNLQNHQFEVDLVDEAGDASVTFDVETGPALDGLMIRQLTATVGTHTVN